jgi:CBS domain-containing protein
MSESSGNADRFLTAIDKIESELREKAKAAPDAEFSDLLKACNWNNRTVRVNMVLLQSLSEIRRAIVLDRGGKQVLLATPSDNTVSEAERMAELLSRHFNVLDFASKPVRTLPTDTPAIDAFNRMKELHTSKFLSTRKQSMWALSQWKRSPSGAWEEKMPPLP